MVHRLCLVALAAAFLQGCFAPVRSDGDRTARYPGRIESQIAGKYWLRHDVPFIRHRDRLILAIPEFSVEFVTMKHIKGILSCFDAKTGEAHYGPQRLEGIESVYASPVAAAGRVYIAGRNGTTVVIKDGPGFEELARNTLDDSFDASPAIAGDELYLRGHKHLYCLAEDGS